MITFPKDFIWGAATAAQQVEGGNTNNDWYEWDMQGHTRDHAGIACDQYHRYAEDFDMARDMGHNAYRLSIEWSRIEPSQNVFSYEAINHYRDELKAARDRGLKTFVTLHHFTNPLWASHQGGWSNDEMPRWFGAFAAFVVPNLGDLVDYWLTLNEPNVTVLTGYTVGLTPPGKKDIQLGIKALANFMKGHAAAYHMIHAFYPDAKVGFAHHMRVFEAYRWWHPGDIFVAWFVDDFWNRQILRAMQTGRIHFNIPFLFNVDEDWPELAGTLDFIGVNYYTRDLIELNLSSPEKFVIHTKENAEHNDVGWEIYPEGMYKSLMKAGSYGLPVYVTENGIADAEDKQRGKFLCTHLREMAHAMEDGADVRGYLHWALIDNWEWIDGFGPRFGLVEMDYATQRRIPRPSARLYSEIIASSSLAACKF